MPAESTHNLENEFTYSRLFAGLGAFGVALQNYQAVTLFISGLANGILPASGWLTQMVALGAGGICSGMVNFWMNVDLLDRFFKRINSNDDYQYQRLNLTTWQKIQYFGGIFVFVVTGILFGLMAFTFTLSGPLAVLSVAAGMFVAGIMTIQEVETWLLSWEPNDNKNEEPLTSLQLTGKWIGHIIAAGNVLALSLLFTLSLAQGLIALNIAAFPALIIGLTIAFTFGAFTEYYFYNFYLAKFCQGFTEKWSDMMNIPNAWFGILCVSINALVNGALTYAGVELLTALLLAAHIALPPLTAIIALAAVSAFFAGSASFILGLDFWIEQNKKKTEAVPEIDRVSYANNPTRSLFPANEELNEEENVSKNYFCCFNA